MGISWPSGKRPDQIAPPTCISASDRPVEPLARRGPIHKAEIPFTKARALRAMAATAGPELAVATVEAVGDTWIIRPPRPDTRRPEPAAGPALIEQLVRAACRHAILVDLDHIEGCAQGRPIITTATIVRYLNDRQTTALSWAIAGATQLDPALLARGLTGEDRRGALRSAQTMLRTWQLTPFAGLPIDDILANAARSIPGAHAPLVAIFSAVLRRRCMLASQLLPGETVMPDPRRLHHLLSPDAGGAPGLYVL